MDNAFIFGAGKYGEVAAVYYNTMYDIKGFIDNDSCKWGKQKNGYTIYSPSILEENSKNSIVIVAVSSHLSSIYRQLLDYGIKGIIFFSISSQERILAEENNIIDYADIIHVSFISGLGNQMFQYAYMKYLERQGKNVFMDLSYYYFHKDRMFELCEIFSKIESKECNLAIHKKYLEEGRIIAEANMREDSYKYDYVAMGNVEKGIVRGYHQNYIWANKIRSELLEDFTFYNRDMDSKAINIADMIKSGGYTSVHIRRGDYLAKNEVATFGGICTLEYYDRAIKYILSQKKNSRFCFLSNDIEWVKENIGIENALYIDKAMFEKYEDWYDMYFMSICDNNIIANSSFSWWGAWLNTNDSKIVVAPDRWVNNVELEDICPLEWVRL